MTLARKETRLASNSFKELSDLEAQQLINSQKTHILDVRTVQEYETLGHIPHSILCPVDWVISVVASLPDDETPLLVYCEHGVRSVSAASLITQAGRKSVFNLTKGLSHWSGSREFSSTTPFGPWSPASWLIENADLITKPCDILDVACGQGRNAILLAAAGMNVVAMDRDNEKLNTLSNRAASLGIPLSTVSIDLENDLVDLGSELYDIILVTHYLHRPLFPALIRALRSDGLLLYETFIQEQAKRGHPRNPCFLLKKGELVDCVSPLKILRQREGDFDNRLVSGIVAQKTDSS